MALALEEDLRVMWVEWEFTNVTIVKYLISSNDDPAEAIRATL